MKQNFRSRPTAVMDEERFRILWDLLDPQAAPQVPAKRHSGLWDSGACQFPVPIADSPPVPVIPFPDSGRQTRRKLRLLGSRPVKGLLGSADFDEAPGNSNSYLSGQCKCLPQPAARSNGCAVCLPTSSASVSFPIITFPDLALRSGGGDCAVAWPNDWKSPLAGLFQMPKAAVVHLQIPERERRTVIRGGRWFPDQDKRIESTQDKITKVRLPYGFAKNPVVSVPLFKKLLGASEFDQLLECQPDGKWRLVNPDDNVDLSDDSRILRIADVVVYS
jgi:hypothetical protein